MAHVPMAVHLMHFEVKAQLAGMTPPFERSFGVYWKRKRAEVVAQRLASRHDVLGVKIICIKPSQDDGEKTSDPRSKA